MSLDKYNNEMQLCHIYTYEFCKTRDISLVFEGLKSKVICRCSKCFQKKNKKIHFLVSEN